MSQHGSQVELYIDRGPDSKNENEAILDKLAEHKNQIEQTFGEPLEWERLETKRGCRITRRYENGGYRNPEEDWLRIQDEAIDAMIRLEKALAPYVAKLKV